MGTFGGQRRVSHTELHDRETGLDLERYSSVIVYSQSRYDSTDFLKLLLFFFFTHRQADGKTSERSNRIRR